jgi:hypothetical protein
MGGTDRCGILFYAGSTTTGIHRSAVGCTGAPVISSQDFSILDLAIEIVGLEGERTNEKWTIFLGYQGKLIMVLPSAARLGCLLLKIFF